MLKTLNQNEMMSVNGGGYYVPVYLCKRYYVQGILRGSSTTYVGTEVGCQRQRHHFHYEI